MHYALWNVAIYDELLPGDARHRADGTFLPHLPTNGVTKLSHAINDASRDIRVTHDARGILAHEQRKHEIADRMLRLRAVYSINEHTSNKDRLSLPRFQPIRRVLPSRLSRASSPAAPPAEHISYSLRR
jgi:hypothetical protein